MKLIFAFRNFANAPKKRSNNVLINVTLRRLCISIVRRRKAVRITYYEFVSVALVMQHAMSMCRIILPSVACPPVQHFSTLSINRYDS